MHVMPVKINSLDGTILQDSIFLQNAVKNLPLLNTGIVFKLISLLFLKPVVFNLNIEKSISHFLVSFDCSSISWNIKSLSDFWEFRKGSFEKKLSHVYEHDSY